VLSLEKAVIVLHPVVSPDLSPATPVPRGGGEQDDTESRGTWSDLPSPLLCAWDEISRRVPGMTPLLLCSFHGGQIALLLWGDEVRGWDPHRLEGFAF
jgi:hypothetical protein